MKENKNVRSENKILSENIKEKSRDFFVFEIQVKEIFLPTFFFLITSLLSFLERF